MTLPTFGDNTEVSLEEWYLYGIKKQWITPPFCYTHDGDPYMTPEEEAEWDEGGDPCMLIIKLIEDAK
jgi:hypothetical protein